MPDAPPAPPPALELRLEGPDQVQAGDAVLIMGGLVANGARPERMSWTLLERPAASQTVLGGSSGSTQQLRTDVPGRYVLQWTAATADGQVQSRQWAVEAVEGPTILTSTGTGRLMPGQATTLVATPPGAPGSGGLTAYRWTLLDAPAGSASRLSETWGQEVSLTADRPGDYRVAVESRQGTTVSRTVRTLSSAPTVAPQASYSYYCFYLVPNCRFAKGVRTEIFGRVISLSEATPITYQWTVLEAPVGSQQQGMTVTGPRFLFTPDAVGQYGVRIDASSPGYSISSYLWYFETVPPPSGRIEAPATALVGQEITLDASGNRSPYGRSLAGLSHQWSIQKSPKGSSATITAPGWDNATPKFRPDRPGEYVISLRVEGIDNYASVAVQARSADPSVVYPPKLLGVSGPLMPGEEVRLTAETESELGHPLRFAWNLGDGTSASGETITHRFSHPGTYQVQATVTDTVTQRFARQILPVTVLVERQDGIPPAPCTGTECAATGPGTYAGQGIGRWLLINDRPHMQMANLDIAGVPGGRRVMVSLTNASDLPVGVANLGTPSAAASAVPSPWSGPQGTYAPLQDFQAALMQSRSDLLQRRDKAHAAHLERDRAVLEVLSAGTRRAMSGRRQILSASPRALSVLPAPGSARLWHDTTSSVDYASRLDDTCSLPDGRGVLFWVDDKATQNTLIEPAQIARDFKPVVCGDQGGFHRLQQLLGAEVFGPHANDQAIQDDPLQPVHILFVDPGPDVYWGAFVHGLNHMKRSYDERSNEALVMYVNARYIRSDLDFVRSSLVHEYMHLVNHYQRTLLTPLGYHESWLEETTAMMAEDLLSSSLIRRPDGSRYAPMAKRIASYQSSWFLNEYLSSNGANYSVGGSLSAYLDRRLGARLLRGLTFECSRTVPLRASFVCLDEQVFRLTGSSLADSYAAMNLSLMAVVDHSDAPGLGLGMPPYVNAEVDLPAIPLATTGGSPYQELMPAGRLYAGSHIYHWETMPSGTDGHYRRKGILVPPGHVLQVLIR